MSFRLALIQMRVMGGRKNENLSHARALIAEASRNGADIVLLPETMDLGWTDTSSLSEAEPFPDGMPCRALAEAANSLGLFVCAGLTEREGSTVFNSAVLLGRSGELLCRHRKLNELDIGHPYYAQGDRLSVVHTELGALGLMICADGFAHGNVVSRTLGYMGADVILSPCAWAVERDHDNIKTPYGDTWRKAYKTVARDFSVWIAGVSNVGNMSTGPWAGWKCIGCSLVIGPDGEEVIQGPYGVDAETVLYVDVKTRERPARGSQWSGHLEKKSAANKLMPATGVPAPDAIPDALRAQKENVKSERITDCVVYPAFPGKLTELARKPCTVTEDKAGGTLTLANGFLAAVVQVNSGVLTAIENRLTGQRFEVKGDQAALSLSAAGNASVSWSSGAAKLARGAGEETPAAVVVRLEEELAGNKVAVLYRLRHDWFWVERHLEFEPGGDTQRALDGVVYGKLAVADGKERVLTLGKFDRPRLMTRGEGGLFAGLGWWFYTVDKDGLYRNDNTAYPLSGRYVSEPWYVGVFQTEPGEPYPGWAWYKAYLHVKKEQTDKQPWWAAWNGGWGQWGLNIEDATTRPYIELAQKLGLKMLLVGGGLGGYGTPRYVELAKTSQTAQANIADLKARGLTWGCLENGGRQAGWADAKEMQAANKLLEECVAHELKAFGFDFFSAPNTYLAHRHVAAYFKACRERLDYTECHLGMSAYGPQFQREVLNNHPADIGHDSSRFSADWCTFLAFRRSRATFQHRWDYLSPDYGMYYFLTHYANWGHPRTYQDPEPQQLMYGPPAYCATGYDFHDVQGFRASVAAVAAFSPVFTFGHLDLKMPAGDVEFARKYIAWVGKNAEVIRRARVCHEDGDSCVVSKIRDGKGAIFLVNCAAGTRVFKVKLALGGGPAKVRQVFPAAEPAAHEMADGAELPVTVRGEDVAILDVNGGLKTLPPPDPARFPVDVAWGEVKDGAVAGEFAMPDVAGTLKKAADPNLPKDILSLEQIGQAAIGCGKLSDGFKQVYGMREDKLIETWKLVPWAYGDRVWFVYRPKAEYQADGPCPKLKVNGAAAPLIPRINYHNRLACPLFFADVTDAIRHGAENEVALSGLKESEPGYGGIYCAAERH